MQVKEYALYKGEELMAMGTKREIAEQLGTTICQTVSIFSATRMTLSTSCIV